MAMLWFRENQVDVAVVETGLEADWMRRILFRAQL